MTKKIVSDFSFQLAAPACPPLAISHMRRQLCVMRWGGLHVIMAVKRCSASMLEVETSLSLVVKSRYVSLPWSGP